MKHLKIKFNLENSFDNQESNKIERYLGDLRHIFLDKLKVDYILKKDDPLIYEVYQVEVPPEPGQIMFGISIVYPGKVGNEYFMTKGHYHKNPNAAEVYLCLKGMGYLIMESSSGKVNSIYMQPGSFGYVPPQWAHRTVNISEEPFVCFYSVPADAGHDYEELEKTGFKITVKEIEGIIKVVPLEYISEKS